MRFYKYEKASTSYQIELATILLFAAIGSIVIGALNTIIFGFSLFLIVLGASLRRIRVLLKRIEGFSFTLSIDGLELTESKGTRFFQLVEIAEFRSNTSADGLSARFEPMYARTVFGEDLCLEVSRGEFEKGISNFADNLNSQARHSSDSGTVDVPNCWGIGSANLASLDNKLAYFFIDSNGCVKWILDLNVGHRMLRQAWRFGPLQECKDIRRKFAKPELICISIGLSMLAMGLASTYLPGIIR